MTTGSSSSTPSTAAHAGSESNPSVHTLALPPLGDATPDTARLLETVVSNPLHQIKTQLQVCIGDIRLTVGELLAAREHQVLVLDRLLTQPVDVMLEGRVVARGELVAVDDQFAVRITELPLPLKP
jgi:flagellar motor switch protein FliN/FliY